MINNIFSVDIEDWFHILDTDAAPKMADWSQMEDRVNGNTGIILDLLKRTDTRATFFVLGWIADRYPSLIREIASAGHEIACHSYSHGLIYRQTADEFRQDLRKATAAIKTACGKTPLGFRAPGFSIRKDSLWALDILHEEGYVYDSSIFPATRGHGGLPGARTEPWKMDNGMWEFPITTTKIAGKRFAFLGGGYLRLLPMQVLRTLSSKTINQQQPLILYVHPRDIDTAQPRLALGLVRNFKSYVGLGTCLEKLEILLETYQWTSFEAALALDQAHPH